MSAGAAPCTAAVELDPSRWSRIQPPPVSKRMPPHGDNHWHDRLTSPTRQVVEGYNRDPEVHGILVQLPLPAHISEMRVLDAISIEKDVDGFSPANVGALAMRGRDPLYVSCTPKVRLAVTGTCGHQSNCSAHTGRRPLPSSLRQRLPSQVDTGCQLLLPVLPLSSCTRWLAASRTMSAARASLA